MLYALDKKIPRIHSSVFIAPSAEVIGEVEIGENSSVWFQSTLRGDVFPIRIGKNTNIQDHSMIHVTAQKYATTIGDNVTVGHRVLIHGATLQDFAFVGMSATILDQAIIEPFGFVAAGALVTPRFVVPAKTLVAGVPAKIMRPLTDEEVRMIENSAKNYVQNAKNFLAELKPL